MTKFEHLEEFPYLLKGRMNSFIATSFDDSMTVEMQMRVLIDWIKKNIALTNSQTDYLNTFIATFDENLHQTTFDILDKWFKDGKLNSIIYTILATISEGSPKGHFASLADLQQAYPTGTYGVYLVTNPDGKVHMYLYQNKQWKDFGIYNYDSDNVVISSYNQNNLIRYSDTLNKTGNALPETKIVNESVVTSIKETASNTNEGVRYPIKPTTLYVRFQTSLKNNSLNAAFRLYLIGYDTSDIMVKTILLKNYFVKQNETTAINEVFPMSTIDSVKRWEIGLSQDTAQATNFDLINTKISNVYAENNLSSPFQKMTNTLITPQPYLTKIGTGASPITEGVFGLEKQLKLTNEEGYFNLDLDFTILSKENGSVTIVYERLNKEGTSSYVNKQVMSAPTTKNEIVHLKGSYRFEKGVDDMHKLYVLSYTNVPFTLIDYDIKVDSKIPLNTATILFKEDNLIQLENGYTSQNGATISPSYSPLVTYRVTQPATTANFTGINYPFTKEPSSTGVYISLRLKNNAPTQRLFTLYIRMVGTKTLMIPINQLLVNGTAEKDVVVFVPYQNELEITNYIFSIQQTSEGVCDFTVENPKIRSRFNTNTFHDVYQPYNTGTLTQLYYIKGEVGIKVLASGEHHALYKDLKIGSEEGFYKVHIKQPIFANQTGYVTLLQQCLSNDGLTLTDQRNIETKYIEKNQFYEFNKEVNLIKTGNDIQRLILISYSNTEFTALSDTIQLTGSNQESAKDTSDNFSIPKISINGDLSGITQDVRKNIVLTLEHNGQIIKEYADLKWQGNSTLSFPKKGYRVRFYTDETRTKKKKVKLDPNDKAKSDFNLKANWQDWTGLNNLLIASYTSELITRNGNELAKETREALNQEQISGYPCMLYINDVCQYLYNVSTKKDEKLFNIDDENPNQGVLGAREWTSGTKFEAQPEVVTIGLTGDFEPEVPDEPSDALKASFMDMYRVVKTGTDSEFVENVDDYLSLQSVANWFVIAVLFNVRDMMGKNMLYQTRDLKRWEIVLYDMDLALVHQFDKNDTPTDMTLKNYVNINKIVERGIKTKVLIPYLVNAWNKFSKYTSSHDIVESYRSQMIKIGSPIYEKQKEFWTEMPYVESYDEKDIFNFIYTRYTQCEEWFTTDYLEQLVL